MEGMARNTCPCGRMNVDYITFPSSSIPPKYVFFVKASSTPSWLRSIVAYLRSLYQEPTHFDPRLYESLRKVNMS